ncbi:MAG: hypothetical protein P9M07_08995 [Candidatus Aceula meridiana]|nr:hypothetical protein [Candidatus Aceula meridiana]
MNKKSKILILAVFAMLISFSSVLAQSEVIISCDDRSIVLALPIEVVQAELYEDGGTIGITVKDAENQEFSFCLDQRVMSKDKGSIFVGADYPDKPGAGKLSHNSEPEANLLNMLALIKANNSSKQENFKHAIDEFIRILKVQ